MNSNLERAIQEIDAALFSGDAFNAPENRDHLAEWIYRWRRRLDELGTSRAPGCTCPTPKPHPCGYAQEIENDHDFRCTCCPVCMERCAEEI